MQPITAINHLFSSKDLSEAEVKQVMGGILAGRWSDIHIAAFLAALRAKGETPSELAAAASCLVEQCVQVENASPQDTLDTAGTGGDGQATFNISTAAAFVAAACGVRVAKHGNRALSGKCGSSDLITALGAKIDLSPQRLSQLLDEVGICFMFAPAHHPALKAVAKVRQELGVRTIFNLLGPIANPARACLRLAGVFDERWLVPYAKALGACGVRRAVVVNGGGMDEFSVVGTSRYALLEDGGTVSEHETCPKDVGLGEHDVAELRITDTEGAVEMFRNAMDNEDCAARDSCAYNAGAALYAAGKVDSIASGVEQALAALADGSVRSKVERFVAATNA